MNKDKIQIDGVWNVREKETPETCGCGGINVELHTCPYREDINGDYETLCSCCSECTHQCLMDI